MTVTISGIGRRCQLVGVGLLVIALAIVFLARPAAAAVTASATPTTGLGATGTMTVTGSGFGTDLNTVVVLECLHGATSSDDCDANTADSSVSANFNGDYSNTAYTYYSLPNPNLGHGISSLTCDATHLCDLVVIQDDYNNFSNPHVNIPLSFDTEVATTTTPTTTPNPTTPTTTAAATTTPTGDPTTTAGGTTTPAGDSTTTAGTGGTTTTKAGAAGGAGTTLAGQGSGATLAPDSGGGDLSGGSSGSGGTLPFTGPPTAAPIIAICGIVILLAGTVMRRVVLRVPDAGVSLS